MQRRRLFRRVFPHVHWRAGADEIAVTKGIIDAANGWPVLIGMLATRWRTSLLPATGMRPVISHDCRRGMGWFIKGLSSCGQMPSLTFLISAAIASMALQNRSISASNSDSVGSIIKVLATGNDMVGA